MLRFNEQYPVAVDGTLMPVPMVVPVSFETNEKGDMKLYLPSKCKLYRVRGVVQKAIAASDNGTVTIKNSAGSTIATITATAADAINTAYDTGVITSANNAINEDSFITLTVAKTTAGGKVNLQFELLVLPE